jgi:hypothetical protein
MGASVLSLEYCVVAEARCNCYLLDINIFHLSKIFIFIGSSLGCPVLSRHGATPTMALPSAVSEG